MKIEDISLIKTQNRIAIELSNLLSVDFLEKIYDSDIEYSPKRDINNTNNLFYNIKENNIIFGLIDILNLEAFPPKNYINIKILKNKKSIYSINCKYNKKCISCIYSIISKALNYSNHKKSSDLIISRKNIYNNFSIKMKDNIDSDVLEELKFLIDYFNNDNSIYEENFYNEFGLSNYKFKFSSKNKTIKFEFEFNKRRYYIFIDQNIIGISNLINMINKAL